jgi:alanyl-tRNA synthetase
VEGLQAENADLRKQIENLLKEKAKNVKGDLKNELTEINDIQFLAKKLDLDASGIKDVCFELGSQFTNLFLLFGAETDGKALLSCYISKELVSEKGLDAGKIVRELGKYIQGGGGGQPFFATAGGKNPDGIDEALKESKKYLG